MFTVFTIYDVKLVSSITAQYLETVSKPFVGWLETLLCFYLIIQATTLTQLMMWIWGDQPMADKETVGNLFENNHSLKGTYYAIHFTWCLDINVC